MTLKELRLYWTKKFPTVEFVLWEDNMRNTYYARVTSREKQSIVEGRTIGELIGLVENFLRN